MPGSTSSSFTNGACEVFDPLYLSYRPSLISVGSLCPERVEGNDSMLRRLRCSRSRDADPNKNRNVGRQHAISARPDSNIDQYRVLVTSTIARH